MLKRTYAFCIIAIIMVMVSCSDSNSKLPLATGKLGSLVLVSEPQIQNDLKGLLDSSFLLSAENATGAEPFLELIRINIADFEIQYSNQKTILVLVDQASVSQMDALLEPFSSATIQELIENPEPKIMSARNVFAQYQHIVYLFGKDAKDLKDKLRKSKDQINSSLMSYELIDQSEKLYKDTSYNDQYFKMIKEELGLGVKIPSIFKLKYHKNKTYWFEHSTTEGNSPKLINLVVHTYPYKDKVELSYESIRSARDTVFKYLIKGELPGTYMGTTESSYYPKTFKENLLLNGNYCTKIKGWWTVRGLSQAGPYVRYVVVSPDKKNLIAFEGFVYKADINIKEPDLRLIEAIALSIK
jgi:hypothetical protein